MLDFEKPISELEGKVKELRHLSSGSELDLADEITRLEARAEKLLRQTYAKLNAWQKTQVARHPERPHFSHYVARLLEDYTPLAGDRAFGDDRAIQGGLARFRGRSVVVIGHEKGTDTEGRVRHNFGMANPEGYRKAVRLMHLAERFGLPVLTLVDTPGAYPGIGAEERGQAEAIARAIETCLQLGVPLVGAIIGEGGSGGAVALAVADRVLMLEHAVYSVISPEGCAAILWRSGEEAPAAAEAMRLTAQDLHQLGVVDQLIPEPLGGAHRAPGEAIAAVGDALEQALEPLARAVRRRVAPPSPRKVSRHGQRRRGLSGDPSAAPGGTAEDGHISKQRRARSGCGYRESRPTLRRPHPERTRRMPRWRPMTPPSRWHQPLASPELSPRRRGAGVRRSFARFAGWPAPG